MDKIVKSSWSDRFWAWLIDVLLICILWYNILIFLAIKGSSLSGYLLLSALLFIYWTLFEGYRGQSFGKMLLNILVTGPLGESITFKDAAIESFGKSFLLPLDIVISWFAFKDSKQRLFNRISNTIVINRIE